MPYFKLNGKDIIPYIETDNMQISENDIDSPKAGRTMGGLMNRGKVTEKFRADIKLMSVKKEVIDWVMPILRNQYYTLETDMFAGKGPVKSQFYTSTRKYTLSIVDNHGVAWYKSVSFNVIQR